jgi:hypothetical protein
MKYTDGITERMSPQLNAGTAATQSLFSKLYRHDTWFNALYGTGGFLELHERMFGDPWSRATGSEPLLPNTLIQPVLELPFTPGERWSLTAGPHPAWKTGSPRGHWFCTRDRRKMQKSGYGRWLPHLAWCTLKIQCGRH